MQVCPNCQFELPFTVVYECPNCGAVFSPDSPKQSGGNEAPDNETTASFEPDSNEKDVNKLDKKIEDKLKTVKEALAKGDFESALNVYRSIRRSLSGLGKNQLLETALNLLEQSANLLVQQKQKIASLEQDRKSVV